jgi:GNAT superfamily N-acetyltransferase
MIIEYKKNDVSNILYVINNSATKYKGVIPDDCWREPYMSRQDLIKEFNEGVQIFGYNHKKKLVGVMGIQKLKNITLIRHAYTLTNYQRTGVGESLLKYLLEINQNTSVLVGTWKNAIWAIQFYKKLGFILHTKKQTVKLLNKYWKISSKQIENSVVLEK